MEILISVVGKISEYLVEPIGRRAGYLVCYNSHKKKLKREAKNLKGIQSRVGHKVDEARRNGKRIEDDVEEWCTQVDEIGEKVKTFFEDEVQVNKRCLGGWCPDLISRYSLGRKAKKMTEEVIELKTVGAFETVFYQAPALGIEQMTTGDFTDFESRKERMDEIMAALKDDNIKAIGICGLGGVGKTTAVKEARNRANVEKLFDVIVMAVVTQTPDIIAIQDKIAEQLGLELKEKTLSVRAGKLQTRLLDCTRVLVILDDVWKALKLEEIGIPLGADQGCKLMLTSRDQDECNRMWTCNRMRTCKNITIGVLIEKESWNLFKEIAGESIESPDLHQIAKDVVKECGDLPIAIVTVGMALKDKTDAAIWRDALHQLKQSCPDNIRGMNDNVYRSLKLSFNFLESQEAKSCLLLCCIFKEDANIPLQDLIRYGVGLCLFKGLEDLVQATDRVHSLVATLKSCYLLLGSEEEEFVKMHDVVRDVIRSIATAGEDGLMLRHGLELKEWPTESTDQLYTSTSFMSNNIQDLLLLELKKWPTAESTAQYDPLLSNKMNGILSLERIGDSVKVPENLFEGMKEVRVLQIRRMFIPSPPPSLALLTKLQTLCIEDCNLKNISLIGELKTLKILSFRGSSIQELPMETGKLTHLRSLDLTECRRLKRISPGVFSSLIRLEQLYMIDCCVRWEVEEGTSERNNVNVAELKSLSDQLTALEIELPASSAKFLVGFKKLVRFFIGIGYTPVKWFRDTHGRNKLIINLDLGIPVESWINDQLLKKTEVLQFQVCSVKNVLNNLNRESLVQLKSLDLFSCDGLEYVIDTVDLIPQSIFPILDTLIITDMYNLKMICHGQLPAGSFAELREIYLKGCNRLKNVFSESIAKGLVQLEILEIVDCEMMEEIVVTERGAEEEVSSKIRFPKLRELRFRELRSLVGFCKKMGDEIEFPQLIRLYLKKLPMLRSFCPSSLGTHECDYSDDSDDSATATQHLLNQKVKSLCELRSITVNHCGKLANVFSSDLIQSLQNLEEIYISKCDSVEVALDFVGVNIEEGHATVPLNRLKKFELSDLPKLICVWKKLPKRIHECQKLQSLKIARCSRLKNIFSPSTTKIAEQLQELDISECEMMTEIVAEDEGDEKATDKIEFLQLRHLSLSGLPNLLGLFPKDVGSTEIHLFNGKVSFYELRVLNVSNCHKILHVAPFHLLKRLQNLEEVCVKSCDSVEEVFEFIGPSVEEGYAVMLSRLKIMILASLPKLMQICKKDHKRTIGFQNLKELEVLDCGSLRNLFDPSVTRGLVHLERLKVRRCVMMEEIVAKGEEQEEGRMDKIVIPKLNYLRLSRLQNLTSFCQDLYAFDLPLLDDVRVEYCPNMKTFSSGFASTPKLKKVRIAAYRDEDLVGDLNNTIQQLFQTQTFSSGFASTPKLKKVTVTAYHEENLMGDLNNTIQQLFQTQALEKHKLFFEGSSCNFDLEDLLSASGEVLGKGSYGTAYKAILEVGTTVVVKRLKEVVVGKRVFEQQMKNVGRIGQHSNVVPLRAYYFSRDEKLLVYDYITAGSLSSLLHGNREIRPPPDWETRLKISLGTARGIAHIHSSGNGKFIHGNIKSSNVLLNQDCDGCISDFGLTPLMNHPSVPSKSPGYRAPEVIETRKFTQKSDVYSFGVLLLEMLTGKAPVQMPGGHDDVTDLPRWVQSVVREEWTAEVFDVGLMEYPDMEEELVQMFQIAMTCVARVPDRRPKMEEVVRMMEDIRPSDSENQPSPEENKSKASESEWIECNSEEPTMWR